MVAAFLGLAAWILGRAGLYDAPAWSTALLLFAAPLFLFDMWSESRRRQRR